MANTETIVGFASYAPGLSLENHDFSANTLRFLVSVENRNLSFRRSKQVFKYPSGKC